MKWTFFAYHWAMTDPVAPAFHVMAKPTGSRCNLSCDYCFFLEKAALYPGSDQKMTDEVMEAFVRQTISAQQVPFVTLAWQGGEPTLMGLDFFRRAVEVERDALPQGWQVERTIQTNGTLLTDEWAAFLAENNVLVGLSIDGPRELHDAYRHDGAGRSVFDDVEAAARLLQKHGAEFNVLCTINAANVGHPLEVYRYFRDTLGARFVQFIPIVEVETAPSDGVAGTVTDRSVGSLAYGEFLSAIFDEWVRHDVGEMFVQFFDGVLAAYVRGYSSLCVLRPTCGEGVALEHNGDVYSCDHFVDPPYLLGNIMETPLGRAGAWGAAAGVWPGQAGHAAALLPGVRVRVCVQRGVPQEPHPAHPRRRTRPELAVRGTEALLRAHGSSDARHLGAACGRPRRCRDHDPARRGGRHHRPQRAMSLRQWSQVQGVLRALSRSAVCADNGGATAEGPTLPAHPAP